MDKSKNNIPTNARMQGKYNGTLTKGWARETNGKLYFQLDGGGWVDMKAIENPVVIYEITYEDPKGDSGAIELSNNVQLFWGKNLQYKTKDAAMALAEAIASLCTGLSISLDELGRAMEPYIMIDEKKLDSIIQKMEAKRDEHNHSSAEYIEKDNEINAIMDAIAKCKIQ